MELKVLLCSSTSYYHLGLLIWMSRDKVLRSSTALGMVGRNHLHIEFHLLNSHNPLLVRVEVRWVHNDHRLLLVRVGYEHALLIALKVANIMILIFIRFLGQSRIL